VTVINPFCSAPVEHERIEELFAGRTRYKQRLAGAVHDAKFGLSKRIAVLGGPGLGKTSLLNFLEVQINEVKPDFLAARLQLDATLNSSKDPLDLFRGIETVLLQQIKNRDPRYVSYLSDVMKRFFGIETEALSSESKVKMDLKLPEIGGMSWERSLSRGAQSPLSVILESDFRELRDRAESIDIRHVFLFIDRGDVLRTLPYNKGTLQLFKSVLENEPFYSIVISGSPDLIAGLGGIEQSFAAQFENVQIGEMTPEEQLDLIDRRLRWGRGQGSTLQFDEKAKARIIEISRGNPRYLVRNCSAVTESVRYDGERVTVEAVNALVSDENILSVGSRESA
jgi:hypothetical protein